MHGSNKGGPLLSSIPVASSSCHRWTMVDTPPTMSAARGVAYDPDYAAHALLIAGPHAETMMKNLLHIPLRSFLRIRLKLKPELASRALPHFAREAKKALLRQCAQQCRRPFAVRVQNAWRPGYFREDLQMLKRVFGAKSFQSYLAVLASRPKRRRAATPGVARAPRRALCGDCTAPPPPVWPSASRGGAALPSVESSVRPV